jgi:hypothetical protein
MKPIYTHDCGACKFLGTVVIDEVVYDLYYCAGEPTIIARFSSEGPEYTSGICFGEASLIKHIKGVKGESEKALMVAYTLAMANGLSLKGSIGDQRPLDEKINTFGA